MVHNTNSGRLYGCEPKCVRVKEIHRLFFYLVYGYNGEENGNQAAMKDQLRLDNPDLDEELFDELPELYQVIFTFTFNKSLVPVQSTFFYCRAAENRLANVHQPFAAPHRMAYRLVLPL